jgi:hypothetical protein
VDGDVFPQNCLGAYAGLFQSYAELLYPVLILSDLSRLWSEIEFVPEADGFPMDRRATLPVGRK